MAQISLYIDETMAERLGAAAKNHNCSVSKYVAALVSDNLSNNESEEANKKLMLKQLCGALDPQFVIPPKTQWEHESPRRFDLI